MKHSLAGIASIHTALERLWIPFRHLTLLLPYFAVEPTVTIQQCVSPLTEGDNTTLHCNATGNPVPDVAWIRKETNEIVSSNNMLHIPDVKRNQSGDYECLAWNGIGNNSTSSCFVDVHCKHVSLELFIYLLRVGCCSIHHENVLRFVIHHF